MSLGFPESDWKIFRQLRELALQRFCEAVLSEAGGIASSTSGAPYDRYIALYRLIQKRDREIVRAFDNPRRSTALMQLVCIHSQGLLEADESARFSEPTRERVSAWLGDTVEGRERADG